MNITYTLILSVTILYLIIALLVLQIQKIQKIQKKNVIKLAHDILTPLTIIKGEMELSRMGLGNKRNETKIERSIEEVATRVAGWVQ